MMARALASAGAARVYIVGRRVDILQAAAADINRPSVVVPLYCDVTSKVSLEAVVSVIEKDVGRLNLLVCNAGVGGPQVKVKPKADEGTVGESGGGGEGSDAAAAGRVNLEEWRDAQLAVRVEDFTQTFAVNSTSVWYTAMAFLTLLDAGNKAGPTSGAEWGPAVNGVQSQVVVTSSIGGFNKSAPGGWAYGPSKAAATHIAKMLSNVLPTWNIR